MDHRTERAAARTLPVVGLLLAINELLLLFDSTGASWMDPDLGGMNSVGSRDTLPILLGVHANWNVKK